MSALAGVRVGSDFVFGALAEFLGRGVESEVRVVYPDGTSDLKRLPASCSVEYTDVRGATAEEHVRYFQVSCVVVDDLPEGHTITYVAVRRSVEPYTFIFVVPSVSIPKDPGYPVRFDFVFRVPVKLLEVWG